MANKSSKKPSAPAGATKKLPVIPAATQESNTGGSKQVSTPSPKKKNK